MTTNNIHLHDILRKFPEILLSGAIERITLGLKKQVRMSHANSNLFLSPYEILPIAPEKLYFRKFSYFIMKLYVVCTH